MQAKKVYSEKLERFVVLLPKSLKKKLKFTALEREVDASEIVRDMLARELKWKDKEK